MSDTPTPGIGDPWIDAYLRLRARLLAGEFHKKAEVTEYAQSEQRTLPGPTPSIPAAMFITADMAITFPESFPSLMAALWVPHDSGRPPRSGNKKESPDG